MFPISPSSRSSRRIEEPRSAGETATNPRKHLAQERSDAEDQCTTVWATQLRSSKRSREPRDGSRSGRASRSSRLTALAAALAWHLRHRGVARNSAVAVDLPNCPFYVLLALAAAYGGFFLVALNNRLTASEKLSRVLELQRAAGIRITCQVDSESVDDFMASIAALLAGDHPRRSQRCACPQKRSAQFPRPFVSDGPHHRRSR